MSGNCNSGCDGCSEKCSSRESKKEDFIERTHELSNIKKVIGVVSGKGGVGKSMVTSMLSVLMNRRGYKTAILDGDITGPSIPRAFGIKEKATGSAEGVFPVRTKTGISIMSVNLLVNDETDPVIWRGPVLANSVKQFWTEIIWNDVDIMFIDMPPGTGDVPLTVFQSIPVDGIIVVTSPQELVSMIVAKAVKMANMMEIPILGLVENYSYVTCPDCDRKIHIFGESKAEKTASEFGIDEYATIPVDTDIANAADKGLIELFEGNWMDKLADTLESIVE